MTDSEIIELLQMQLKTQQQQNDFLQKTIESLNQNIETLTQKIADLEEKLNKNSRNSSKPPSSDGYSKPNPKSLRPKSEKKAGGQKGHKSSNLSVPKKIDRTVSHYPARCEKCPLFEKCKGTVCVPAEKRYTVDIIVKTDVVEHQVFRMNGCAKHGGMHRGEFSEGVNAYIQYGQNLSSLLVNLSMDGMSADHLHKTIGRMFDIPLSTGTIINKLEKCAGLVSPLMDRIKEKIVQGPVAHFDETGIRVEGKTKWVHSSSNRDFTYLTLSDKLAKLKDSMLLFARNFEVPFTNNAAERTIRNLKSKSKVAGNFRSDDGARWYLKIRSYIDSARKHGINAFESVKLAFTGTPALCLGF